MADPWFFEVLAIRPAPLPDECFSGYLLRLADANGYADLWDLANVLFPHWHDASQVSQLRWEYPVPGWESMLTATQLPLAALEPLTLLPLVQKYHIPQGPTYTRAGGATAGHHLRGVVNPQARVCPACLRAVPYLRLLWRLQPILVCLDHGCKLQSRCHQCQAPLEAAHPSQQHLRCVACGADWRRLPIQRAPAALLKTQQTVYTETQFLLDPQVALAVTESPADLPRALGIKFRYLRSQSGLSAKAMAERLSAQTSLQLNVLSGRIGKLERGEQVPLSFYWSYLEALSTSWATFAALQVPPEFVREAYEPAYMSLRLCPNPECPNHRPPPHTTVYLFREFSERRVIQFRCTVCGQRFTRRYTGELVPPRSLDTAMDLGDPPRGRKPPEQVARLVELGLQGHTNRWIAQELGWGLITISRYWQTLGLRTRVRQAQAARRAEQHRQHGVELGKQVEAQLAILMTQDKEITMQRLCRAVGMTDGILDYYLEMGQGIQERMRQHNAAVRQRRDAGIQAKIAQTIETLEQSEAPVTLTATLESLGLTQGILGRNYPELWVQLNAAVRALRARCRAVQIAGYLARIDAAVAQLVAQGTRLTRRAILSVAGMTTSHCRIPAVHAALEHWAGHFGPGN